MPWSLRESVLYQAGQQSGRRFDMPLNYGDSMPPSEEASVKQVQQSSVHESKPKAIGTAGWLAIAGMGAVLGLSIWFLFYGWNLTNAAISTHGIIALVLGVVLSLALGSGLMALVFYSNRKGYDR